MISWGQRVLVESAWHHLKTPRVSSRLKKSAIVLPEVSICRHCNIENAVVQKGCKISAGTEIGVNKEKNKKRFHVTPTDVVPVTPEMLGQELHRAP